MKSGRSIVKVGRAALVAAALLTGGAAVAQQPAAQPAPQPAQPAQPGQPIQLQPVPRPMPGQPMPGQPMPGQPMQGLPAGHPALQPGVGGFPPPPGGLQPGRGPGRPLPPGLQRGNAAAPPAHAKEPRPEHCPGHGPLDAPHHVNWWHGMLMVNNKRAQEGGFLNTLLFRYENEENPCDEKNEPPPFLASLLNFGLLAFILVRFGRKPINEALGKRKQSIMKEIDDATELLNSSQRRLDEYKAKFAKMTETLEELKAEQALQSELEKKHMLAEAEERRARMKRDAEFRIEQELKAAKAELLQAAVQGAVLAAEDLLKKSTGAQDQDRMTKEYLGAIPAAFSQNALGATQSAGASGGHS